MLSAALQERVKQFEPYSYGIKRVILRLGDGNAFEASIAWNRHIVFIRGYGLPPFDPAIVVDAIDAKPGDEPQDDEPKPES